MPAYSVQRSITIDAPAEKIFDAIADFTTWPTWSPWLPIDRAAALDYTGEPGTEHSGYSWSGEVVGQGEMEHLRLDRPHRIEDDLRFLKPMKARSDVSFDLKEQGGSTNVTWNMDGKLPFFLFWLKPQIETFIAMDYDRGLRMLKEYLETGSVLSELEVVGVESYDEMEVIGKRGSAQMLEVGSAMGEAFGKVGDAIERGQMPGDGEMISVYHANDMKKGRLDFTSGYVVPASTDTPAGMDQVRLSAGKFLQIRHTGCYQNLGNAWSGAYQYARYKKLKVAKRPAFEIYRNHPDPTPPAELITDVCIPLK
ncbi:MAG: GyrI-like domain-containing protein [Planctomycetota bacterium]